ncbi:unnamed protein product [Diatraea saccharalis]|uniref:Peptidase S1 domain-containing protein n=1 Tax=Diatraea saccharalis TaxID=40085 RepID=A0A9N9WK56_9NEOP|nr:unnamed protein product [Diatraea saccharalis]
MRVLISLVVVFSVATAAPTDLQRIAGGSTATINQYPEIVALLFSNTNSGHRQLCAGTIISSRSVLTVAHCTSGYAPGNWRIRAGSVNANSGGIVFDSLYIINHSQYNPATMENDISIIRTSITFTNVIQPATRPSSGYVLGDDQAVWAVGWGATSAGGALSARLRHVQVWTVNNAECKRRYTNLRDVTDSMLCTGWDMGGRGQCTGDDGGPLYHGTTVVGISSWRFGCGQGFYPSVNTQIVPFLTWITNNA